MAESAGCGYRIKALTDFYPKHENKLAKYLGCRRQLPPTPLITGKGLPVGQLQGCCGGMRHAANWVLHECGPVRMSCNIFHNRVLKIDETLALLLWNDDGGLR
jgi:hypothetical protein